MKQITEKNHATMQS